MQPSDLGGKGRQEHRQSHQADTHVQHGLAEKGADKADSHAQQHHTEDKVPIFRSLCPALKVGIFPKTSFDGPLKSHISPFAFPRS
jgi:hypothetical protein